MARIVRKPPAKGESRNPALVEELVTEIRARREIGQPRIEESHLKNNTIHVRVFWDKWDGVPDEDRSQTILAAYQIAENPKFNNQIAVATGLTFPEAADLGLLPYQLVPHIREEDKVDTQKLQAAMVEEGGSWLFDPRFVQLRFADRKETEQAQSRLEKVSPSWSVFITAPIQQTLPLY